MLNYLKKFAMEIVPSVAATIIGAYIVNHYIAARPAADAPAAAVVSTAKPKSDSKTDPKPAAKGEAKQDTAARQADEQTEGAGMPSGVKAKGVSERAILEKNAAAEKAIVVEKPAEKLAPVETTASLPVEPRRSAPPPREKTVAKSAPPTVQPVVATAPAEITAAPERDANDLARAAIERLRGNEGPRAPETAHAPETPRTQDASRAATAPATGIVKPLPPPIIVAAPPETADQARPPYAAASRGDDPSRPTPPAEIPTARPPLDLRAEMMAASAPREKTSIGEDVLTAAKSMFHAVLPKSSSSN